MGTQAVLSAELIYHKDHGGASPFDCRAVKIADGAQLLIACPYLSLEYFVRLTKLAAEWKLITDLAEWLSSTTLVERQSTVSFILENRGRIRDSPGLHAKALIGNNASMVGSANFTFSGMTRRTEMGVHLADVDSIRELITWFDLLWTNSGEIESGTLREFLDDLPPPITYTQRPAVSHSGIVRDVPLVSLEQVPDWRHYKNAIGYYTGDGSDFCVCKGSVARSNTVERFHYNKLGERLINAGVLQRSGEYGDYIFAVDYVFSSHPHPQLLVLFPGSRAMVEKGGANHNVPAPWFNPTGMVTTAPSMS
jgi:PLD-like domain